MDPPVLLCCVSRGSGTLAAIRHAGRFAVHLLTEEQPSLADRFSRPAGNGSRFAGMGSQVRVIGGTPVIAGALAVAWCDLYSLDEIGDHTVVYGRPSDVRVGGGGPLLWHERDYRRLDTISSTA
jgi:flavin reductase (DIM6/NTAB) family NADH-FMN oxidoreductase RutF